MTELNCFGKTEHYGSKITLLNAYDTNNNGKIDMAEMMQSMTDHKTGKITMDEMNVITQVWKLGEDGISKFCRRRPPCGDYGDIDGDGWVSAKDLVHTMRYVAGFSDASMTSDQKRRADVNGDGKVNAVDAMLMAKYLAGVYDTFAVCAGAPSTPSKPDCAKADINHDGIVDINDSILLGAAYGSHPGDPTWNPDADLNNDGVVDQKDLAILGACMGTVATPPPKPECKEGDVKAGFVCSGGKWVPTGTPTPPGKPPATPPVTPPAYLTPDEALLRIRAGEKCYIRCTLPILSMLPGIPYMQGIPILPGFAITTEP